MLCSIHGSGPAKQVSTCVTLGLSALLSTDSAASESTLYKQSGS